MNRSWYDKKKIKESQLLYERLTNKLLNQKFNILKEGRFSNFDDVISNIKDLRPFEFANELTSLRRTDSRANKLFNAFLNDSGNFIDPKRLEQWLTEYNGFLDKNMTKSAIDMLENPQNWLPTRVTPDSEPIRPEMTPGTPRPQTTLPSGKSPEPGDPEFTGPSADLEPRVYKEPSKKPREQVKEFYEENQKALDNLKRSSKNDEEWYTNFFNFYIQETGKQAKFEFFKTAIMSDTALQRGFISSTGRAFSEIAKDGLAGLKKWKDGLPLPLRVLIWSSGVVGGLTLFGLSLFHFAIVGNLIPWYTGISPTIFNSMVCGEVDPSTEKTYSKVYICRVAAEQVEDDAGVQSSMRSQAKQYLEKYNQSLKNNASVPAKVENAAPSSTPTPAPTAQTAPASETNTFKVGEEAFYIQNPKQGCFRITQVNDNTITLITDDGKTWSSDFKLYKKCD